MKKLALALGLAGMLLLSGCGGGDSGSSVASTPVQPAPPAEPEGPPMSDNGNEILVPGYDYDAKQGKTFEMYVQSKGKVLFAGDSCRYDLFDENYNEVEIDENNGNDIVPGNAYEFESGHYYLTLTGCRKGSLSVESNVL